MSEVPSWKPTLLKCLAVLTAALTVCTWIMSTLGHWLRERIPVWVPFPFLKRVLLWLCGNLWAFGVFFGLYVGIAFSALVIAIDARKGRLPPWR